MAKPSTAILALGLGKPKADSEDDAPGAERADAEEMAASDMIDAVKSNDPAAFSEALRRHYKACGMDVGGSSDGGDYGEA